MLAKLASFHFRPPSLFYQPKTPFLIGTILRDAYNRIISIGKNPNKKDNYKFTPDVIIHKRKTINADNLVVIEIKKDISPSMEKEFDLIKLEHLTIDYLGNHYNYDLGIAIIFGTKENAGTGSMTFFQNGIENETLNLSVHRNFGEQ